VNITAIMLGFFGVLKLATLFAFILAVVWINRRYGTRKREAAILNEQEQGNLGIPPAGSTVIRSLIISSV